MKEELSTLQKLIDTLVEFFVNYSFQVVGAVIILIIGVLIAHSVTDIFLKFTETKKWDITLSKFLAGGIKILILGFAVLIALGKFGITIAPFIAALSALTFGASFAIQGPLSNYGAGISIIMGRPFVVGNTITVAGVSGVVQEVKLACTILTNEEGVKITIPNKHIVGEILYNSQENRLAEGLVGISYDSDPEMAIGVVRRTVEQFSEVTKDPRPQIGIRDFGDSAVNIGYRYWVPTAKYFQITYAVNLAIYKALQTAKIPIPFPQRDIHIISQPATASSLGEPR